MNFCDLDMKLRDTGYKPPPPVKYNFQNYSDEFSRVGNTADKSCELKPLDQEDMARHSDEDVQAEFERRRKTGWNPTRLGSHWTMKE